MKRPGKLFLLCVVLIVLALIVWLIVAALRGGNDATPNNQANLPTSQSSVVVPAGDQLEQRAKAFVEAYYSRLAGEDFSSLQQRLLKLDGVQHYIKQYASGLQLELDSNAGMAFRDSRSSQVATVPDAEENYSADPHEKLADVAYVSVIYQVTVNDKNGEAIGSPDTRQVDMAWVNDPKSGWYLDGIDVTQ